MPTKSRSTSSSGSRTRSRSGSASLSAARGSRRARPSAKEKPEGVLARVTKIFTGDSEEPRPEKVTALLRKDHDKVRDLFKKFENPDDRGGKSKKQIVDEISEELGAHAAVEEKIFYPACRKIGEEKPKKIVAESVEEHLIVKRLIKELSGLRASDEQFEAKVTVLKESVEHHAGEEERDLFPEADSALGQEQLIELGRRMEEMKQRLLARQSRAS